MYIDVKPGFVMKTADAKSKKKVTRLLRQVQKKGWAGLTVAACWNRYS
jgi:Txe/YoeB family toxin of Txe-Axe toxin-antitoxin module